VGIELVKTGPAYTRDAAPTNARVPAAARRGLILLPCGLYSNVIRLLAPLTIQDALLKEGFNLLEQALDDIARSASAA
jgi:4-aminobutyrate aminotransferase-like enzyme